MKDNQTNSSKILINFGFEEVNEAVFRNAQIWRYKKVLLGREEIIVLVPEVFSSLYYHADKIITFKPRGCASYGEISDVFQSKQVLRWYELLRRIHVNLCRISLLRRFSYYCFQRSPRQEFFYIKNHLQRDLLKICKGMFRKFKYIRMSDYYDLSLMGPTTPSLPEWHKTNHEYIHQMISTGGIYRIRRHSKTLARPKIVLRTRNFKNKAVVHNSKKDVLLPLVLELLKFDCEVVNIGVPHLPLGIEHPNYQEYSHCMSIVEEFELCGNASCAIMTTEAGMFLGFSATDMRIVQYDDEIFERCFNMSLSFFQARKEAGLDDLDVRSYVHSSSWSAAAESIYNFVLNENRDTTEKQSTFALPETINLGIV